MDIDIKILDDVVIIGKDTFHKNPIDNSVECIMKGCSNKRTICEFVGNLCKPCYDAISTGDFTKHGLGVVGSLHRKYNELLVDKSTVIVNYRLPNNSVFKLDIFIRTLVDLEKYYRTRFVDLRINGLEITIENLYPLLTNIRELEITIRPREFIDGYEIPNQIIKEIIEDVGIVYEWCNNYDAPYKYLFDTCVDKFRRGV